MSGISIQQTTFPIHLLNLSIFTIDLAIHDGMSLGIFPEPPRLSAIISSDISSLVGSSAIKILLKKLERTIKSALIVFQINYWITLMLLREPFLASHQTFEHHSRKELLYQQILSQNPILLQRMHFLLRLFPNFSQLQPCIL